MAPKLFEGLKVVDCASFIAAPAAATILSDFGADVIKLEPPTGDPYRISSSRKGRPQSKYNYNWMLEARNRRSLAVDLTKPESRRILQKLVEATDIFITNMPLAVRAKLGITYAELNAMNPRLIYASFTGYGETGDEMNKPGFDVNAWWARSGLMDFVRDDPNDNPAIPANGMGDHASSLALFGAIASALYRREKDGKGGEVRSSLMANGAWANGYMIQARLCDATFAPKPPRNRPANALANYYRCRNGRWVMMSLLNEERQWPKLVECLGAPELLTDERFVTAAARADHSVDLASTLDRIFAQKDHTEWRKLLDGTGLVFSVVANLDDVANDQQMRDNKVFVRFADEAVETVDSPLTLMGEEKVVPRMPPAIGQHTDAILSDLGFSADEVRSLDKAGAIKRHDG